MVVALNVLRAMRSVGAPWSYLIVFALAASEASLFVGLVVPGETVLLVAGFLAYRGDINLVGAMAAAAVGAIVGDSIGYEIGRHLGHRLEATRIGRWIGEERWEKARSYLKEKGGKAIFLGRFVSFARSLVPALAGDARMEYGRFLAWNAAGAIIWAIAHVGAGYVAGPSYKVVERVIGPIGLSVVALVVIGLIGVRLVRKRRANAESSEVR